MYKAELMDHESVKDNLVTVEPSESETNRYVLKLWEPEGAFRKLIVSSEESCLEMQTKVVEWLEVVVGSIRD